jgi:alpha(1,3/1,4) fucosyltransferase
MITLSYVNFWKDPTNDNYFTQFINKNIDNVQIVNYNNNPDILIASVFGGINIVQNSKAKCKIFYYGENLDRYSPYNNEKLLLDTFDLVVGFKYTDLEKKQIRFPLWLMYYKFYNYKPEHNIIDYIETKYKKNIKKEYKTVFTTLIARHDRGGQRTKIYNEIVNNNYGIVMCPSNLKKNTNSIGNTTEDKINYISKSIYNICPENSTFEGYFTEKLIQAFEGGTIPFYWAIDLPEKGLINENKYCYCDIDNPIKLKENIKNAIENPNYYLEGNVFTDNAPDIISNYYNTLINNIKIKLNI